MRGAQYAYQRRLGTEVPLCIMNMVSEWAVMHRRELWDQGHDLSHAFDRVRREFLGIWKLSFFVFSKVCN